MMEVDEEEEEEQDDKEDDGCQQVENDQQWQAGVSQ